MGGEGYGGERSACSQCFGGERTVCRECFGGERAECEEVVSVHLGGCGKVEEGQKGVRMQVICVQTSRGMLNQRGTVDLTNIAVTASETDDK